MGDRASRIGVGSLLLRSLKLLLRPWWLIPATCLGVAALSASALALIMQPGWYGTISLFDDHPKRHSAMLLYSLALILALAVALYVFYSTRMARARRRVDDPGQLVARIVIYLVVVVGAQRSVEWAVSLGWDAIIPKDTSDLAAFFGAMLFKALVSAAVALAFAFYVPAALLTRNLAVATPRLTRRAAGPAFAALVISSFVGLFCGFLLDGLFLTRLGGAIARWFELRSAIAHILSSILLFAVARPPFILFNAAISFVLFRHELVVQTSAADETFR